MSALARVRGVCTVRVIEADTESAQPFMVTEYAEGPSLAEYVDQHGTLGADMLYGLATGLAEALTAIHAAGIVHRDLKPSNVILDRQRPEGHRLRDRPDAGRHRAHQDRNDGRLAGLHGTGAVHRTARPGS